MSPLNLFSDPNIILICIYDMYVRKKSICLLWRLFVLSFFPRDVLEKIWDLTESVSEGFLSYSF